MGNNNKIKLVLVSLAAALLITAILLTAVIFDRNKETSDVEGNLDKVMAYGGVDYVLKDRVETFLILGLDKYEENITSDSYNNNQQSDFLMLMVFDNEAKTYSTIHINRDTMVDIDVLGVAGNKVDSVRKQIALAHTYGNGGAISNSNVARSVSSLLCDVRINYTMSLTLDSIGAMNGIVGGVTIDEVLDDFSDVEGGERLIKGAKDVTLTDAEAQLYVQHRRELDDSSNANRMIRQRQYLEAMRLKIEARAEADDEFPVKAALEMSEYMMYNCSETVLQGLAEKMQEYEFVEIKEIDGESSVGADGKMEFVPNEDSVKQLVINLFYKPKK